MLKLHQHFFRTSLIFSFITFIIALIVSYYFIKNNQEKAIIGKLSSAVKVATINKSIDINYLKTIAKELNLRATLIDKKGVVLYDSLYNKDKMENHLKRPEIQEAKLNGMGSSIRYSTTLKRDLIYVAKKIPQGYLRFAAFLESIQNVVYKVVLEVAIFLIVLILIIFYISSKINIKITNDSKRIKEALNSLLNKDFSIYLSNLECCKEFNDIGKRIEKVAKKLKKREKQKSRYTKRLKDITKRQSDIISAISHEFKNPVAAIVGYAQTINDTPDLNSELKKKFLTKIEDNAAKISNMIDTLALSINLENNAIALTLNRFNLKDVAISSKDTLLQKYKNRDIELDCSDIFVTADKNMFENIFINLLDNALKYSEDKVILKCKNGLVEVIDYGIGIEPQDIEKIKEKFYRVNEVSWNNSIGVGLYIVDYILKLHNLSLDIKSDNNRTVFSFDINKIVSN